MNDKTDLITSVQNPRIKAVAKLRERRTRSRLDCIVIDGRRESARALEAGIRIREVFYCPPLLGHDADRCILQPAGTCGARLTEVNQTVLAKISYGDRAEGVVATATRPMTSLGELRLTACPILAVIEGIEKPGNLGAILRSADGAGVDAALVVDPVTDVYGPNVIRSSLGTVFCLPIVEVSAVDAIRWLRDRHIAVVAASPDADEFYTDIALTGPIALAFGCEAQGLTATWRQASVVQAKVPMLGRADSLNVSTTAALFFYETLRQRGLS